MSPPHRNGKAGTIEPPGDGRWCAGRLSGSASKIPYGLEQAITCKLFHLRFYELTNQKARIENLEVDLEVLPCPGDLRQSFADAAPTRHWRWGVALSSATRAVWRDEAGVIVVGTSRRRSLREPGLP